jgi:hypothetical protein
MLNLIVRRSKQHSIYPMQKIKNKIGIILASGRWDAKEKEIKEKVRDMRILRNLFFFVLGTGSDCVSKSSAPSVVGLIEQILLVLPRGSRTTKKKTPHRRHRF